MSTDSERRRFELVAKYGAVLGEKLYQKELRDAKEKITDDRLTMKLGKAERLIADLEKEEDEVEKEKEHLLRIREDFLLAEKETKRVNELLAFYEGILQIAKILYEEFMLSKDTQILTLMFEVREKENSWQLIHTIRDPSIAKAEALKKASDISHKRITELLDRLYKGDAERAKDIEKFEADLRKQDELLRRLRNERRH